jgi:uncharacterized integral membrane protein
MNTKNTICVSLVAVAIVLLVTFVLQNTDIVIVNFLQWTFTPSVAALIVFTFIIGILCGVTVDIILNFINKKKKNATTVIKPAPNNTETTDKPKNESVTELKPVDEITNNDAQQAE